MEIKERFSEGADGRALTQNSVFVGGKQLPEC